MAQPLIVPLPPGLDLWGGCIIRVTALNPTTGNVESGVQVSNISFDVHNTGSGPLDFGPFMLVTGPSG